jgi:hypothetical protein
MATRDFLKEFGHFKPLDNSVQAPWTKFPNVDNSDMFWRMGKGEEYLTTFGNYFNQLSKREKVIYRLTNPEPYEWTNFYD